MSSVHPFEETEAGNYRVVEPVDGMEPKEMTIVVGGRSYTLRGYVGKDPSKIRPDVLVYEKLWVEG